MYGSYAAVVKNIDLSMKQLMLCFRIIFFLMCIGAQRGRNPGLLQCLELQPFSLCVCVWHVRVYMYMCGCAVLSTVHIHTVFPRIVSANTVNFSCSPYSNTKQGRILF